MYAPYVPHVSFFLSGAETFYSELHQGHFKGGGAYASYNLIHFAPPLHMPLFFIMCFGVHAIKKDLHIQYINVYILGI